MAIAFNYLQQMMNTTKVQESYRKTFGKWEDDDSLNMLPIYWQSIREIQAEDPGASAEFNRIRSFRIRFSRLFKQRWPLKGLGV
jgi:hypothetical protein